MANIDEVYGDNYTNDNIIARQKTLIDIITNNISHRQFSFHFDGCDNIWTGRNIDSWAIDKIQNSVAEKNNHLTIKRIDRYSKSSARFWH